MSNLLKILFIAVTFFYSNAKNSTPAKPNPVENLIMLMSNWKAHNHMDICFVHAIDFKQNLSLAETSCRAVKSLNETCTMKYNIAAIRRNLQFLQNNTRCGEHKKKDERMEDLFTFLNQLKTQIQRLYSKHYN